MLRIIIRTNDVSMCVNCGGDINTSFKTFDVDLPEVEAFLTEAQYQGWKYVDRQVVGIEVRP